MNYLILLNSDYYFETPYIRFLDQEIEFYYPESRYDFVRCSYRYDSIDRVYYGCRKMHHPINDIDMYFTFEICKKSGIKRKFVILCSESTCMYVMNQLDTNIGQTLPMIPHEHLKHKNVIRSVIFDFILLGLLILLISVFALQIDNLHRQFHNSPAPSSTSHSTSSSDSSKPPENDSIDLQDDLK